MTYRIFRISLGLALLTSASPAFASYKQHMFPNMRATVTETGSSTQQEVVLPVLVLTTTGTTISTQVMDNIAPAEILTRAEFTALVVEKMYTQNELDRCYWDIASSVPPMFTLVFTDVHVGDRFAKHICVAMRDGIVDGYADGSFRGERQINFAESAKILSRAYALAPYAHLERGAPWYRAHVQALAAKGAIPTSINRLDQLMTGAQSTEMLARIAGGVTVLPSRTYEELMPKPRAQAASASPKPSVQTKPTTAATSSTTSAAISSRINALSSSSASSVKKSLWNPF